MKIVDIIAAILLVIGGLNWGMVGLLNFNLVEFIFRGMELAERGIYIVVGLAALYQIFQWKAIQNRWR